MTTAEDVDVMQITLVEQEPDYLIVSDQSTEDLCKKVRAKMKAGYRLHGDAFVFRDAVCQAMGRQLYEP